MAKQKKENMAQKSMDELKAKVQELRAKLLDATLQHSKHALKDTTSIARMRKEVARALTAMQMKAKEVKNG